MVAEYCSPQAIAGSFFVSGDRTRLRFYGEAQKNRRDQLTPITPDFAELLLATPEEDRTGLVFKLKSQTTGRQLGEERIGRVVSAIGRQARVVTNPETGEHATAHDLRRSFGTRWAPRVKPPVLRQLMRHANIMTTMDYYVAQDADDVSEDLWQQADSTFHSTLTPTGDLPGAGLSENTAPSRAGSRGAV